MKHDEYYGSERKEIAQFLPPVYKNVLEIGCGAGGFRKQLSPMGVCWGIEPMPEVANKAKGSFDKLLVGTFEEVFPLLPDGFFDLVVCNDVIEHMVWTDRFLIQIAQKLSPAGYLVGSIPNVRHISNLYNLLIRKDWEYVQGGILDNTHFRFFTYKSLIRTFNESPFYVEECRGFRRSRFNNPLFNVVLWLAASVFGFDSLYLQFGFRLRLKEISSHIDSERR